MSAGPSEPRLGLETVVCVDLRPFDPSAADGGVAAYLDLLGFAPTHIVFLNFFVDFLHGHRGVDDTPINRMTVGQRGTPSDHAWTKAALRRLVGSVRDAGIEAHLGILASTRSDIWSDVAVDDALDLSAILQTKRDGGSLWSGSINPLKRFEDGTPYEDRFIDDLVTVLDDFGFDGYVAGDGMLGLRGPRETLTQTDFSDDMVAQFVTATGLDLPPFDMIEARADHIVRNHYRAWVGFYVERWGSHVQKVASALRATGRRFMAIDAWSRNPEEAISAFGIDYRLLYERGLEAVFVQARETNKWRKHREGEYVREENSVYTFLAHKAYEPRLRYFWAEATANRPEFWNSVLDLPHVLERETYAYLWTRTVCDGAFVPTVDGICVIWGNDVSRPHWRWLSERWQRARDLDSRFARPAGATLVWTESGVLDRTPSNTVYGHRFAALLNDGVCMASCVHERDVDLLGNDVGPLVCLDPDLLVRRPDLASRVFVVAEDRIEHAGRRFGRPEGIERIKRAAGLRSSRGRVIGFFDVDEALVLSLENPGNAFYEHVEVEVPFVIGDVSVLPPREWYAIPESERERCVSVSVAPDAATQVVIVP